MTLLSLISLSTLSFAGEQSPAEAVDIAPIHESLSFFELPTGELFVGQAQYGGENFFYEVERGRLYRVPVGPGQSASDGNFDLGLVDRRSERNQGFDFKLQDGRYFFVCTINEEQHEVVLTKLSAEEGAKRTKRSQYFEPFWQRNFHLFARDDHGIYYYVDKPWMGGDSSVEVPADGYNVYIGWLDEMLLSPLKLVAKDSIGEVYGTSGSNQRLVSTHDEIRYFDGGGVRTVHRLAPYDISLIYVDGGIHTGKIHGTPCDRFYESR